MEHSDSVIDELTRMLDEQREEGRKAPIHGYIVAADSAPSMPVDLERQFDSTTVVSALVQAAAIQKGLGVEVPKGKIWHLTEEGKKHLIALGGTSMRDSLRLLENPESIEESSDRPSRHIAVAAVLTGAAMVWALDLFLV